MCHSQPGWLLSGCDQVLLPTRKASGLSLGSEVRIQDVGDCKALNGKAQSRPPLFHRTPLCLTLLVSTLLLVPVWYQCCHGRVGGERQVQHLIWDPAYTCACLALLP